MKKLKLTKLSKDEIGKNQLSKIRGGIFCGCGTTCRLTGERRWSRINRSANPPEVLSD